MLETTTPAEDPDVRPTGPPSPAARLVEVRPRPAVLRRRALAEVTLARRMASGLVRPLEADASPWRSLHLSRATPSDRRHQAGPDGATPGLASLHGLMTLRTDDLHDMLSLLSGIQLPDGVDGLDVEARGLRQLACARLPVGIARALGDPAVVDASTLAGPHAGSFGIDIDIDTDTGTGTGTDPATDPVEVRLTLCSDDDERHTFPLWMSAETLRRWTDVGGWTAPQAPAPTGRIAALALPAAWWLGRVSLPAARLAHLRPGDALWLPIADARGEHLLAIGSHLLKTTGAPDASCVFAGWGSPGGADSNPLHAFAVSSAPLMDTLTVDLDFIAGRVSLTVGDLCELQIGSVLQLETLMPAQVRIVAHGTQLGAGELVDVDGRLAVEIVEWDAR